MAIEAGRLLNQRYRLIRPIGQGSQASVWVAEHLSLTTHVAVKLIDPELAKKESARERFRREATAAAQLRSAHVVQILDHGIDGDQPFIVMELLDGEDLFERLAHRSRLSLRETSKIVTQVARALSRAHAAGIVHRDLKPENVFLCPNEDDEVVKVLDFGVAKVKDAAKVTMQKTGVGTLIGTPHYMSPEQVKGIGEIDYHTDLWALGVIAFQCVTGELPYDSEGVGDLLIKITIGDAPIPSKVFPGVPANFDAWFAKACARDPQKRFQSAREMAVALAGVVGVIDGVAPRAPTVRPPAGHDAGVGSVALPRPPRAATEQLDAVDWEEIDPFDDEDDAPTRMKSDVLASAPPMAPAATAEARKGTPGGATKAPAQPVKPGTSAGVRPITVGPGKGPAPPQPSAKSTEPQAPKVPRPVTMGDPQRVPAVAMGDPQRVPAVTMGDPLRVPQTPPTTHAPPVAPSVPAPSDAPPLSPRPVLASEGHDIVDFDETIPAHDLDRGSIALPLVVRAGAGRALEVAPLSDAPPPPHPDQAGPAPPSPPPSQRDAAGPALIAPVVLAPLAPRPAIAPPPAPRAEESAFGPASVPRPPPSSRNLPPPSGAFTRPSAVPVVTPLEGPTRTFLTEPPPELDGSSKRRRMVRFMVAGLVLFAAGLTWTVVRSQLDTSPGVPVPPVTASSSVAPLPPPPPPRSAPSTTAKAVDPGRVTHPGKSIPTVPIHRGPRHVHVPKQPSDGTIIVPDPDDDSVPPAP